MWPSKTLSIHSSSLLFFFCCCLQVQFPAWCDWEAASLPPRGGDDVILSQWRHGEDFLKHMDFFFQSFISSTQLWPWVSDHPAAVKSFQVTSHQTQTCHLGVGLSDGPWMSCRHTHPHHGMNTDFCQWFPSHFFCRMSLKCDFLFKSNHQSQNLWSVHSTSVMWYNLIKVPVYRFLQAQRQVRRLLFLFKMWPYSVCIKIRGMRGLKYSFLVMSFTWEFTLVITFTDWLSMTPCITVLFRYGRWYWSTSCLTVVFL